MTEIKQTVAVTNCNVEKLSRHDLLDWVNSTVNGQYKKIEELCTGVAYCQLMELLFPQCIGLKKVKIHPKLEHEYLHNLKLFQLAFTKIQFDKTVPIERLLKGRFQDNFEFLQWFKKFFDVHSAGKENLKVPAALAAAAINAPKPIRRPLTTAPVAVRHTKTTPPAPPPPNKSASQSPKNDNTESADDSDISPVSPSSVGVLKEQLALLQEQIKIAQTERNIYFKKLSGIETLLNETIARDEHVEWSRRALDTLYTSSESTDPVSSESS